MLHFDLLKGEKKKKKKKKVVEYTQPPTLEKRTNFFLQIKLKEFSST